MRTASAPETRFGVQPMARKKKVILSEPLRDRLKTINVRPDERKVITIGAIHVLGP